MRAEGVVLAKCGIRGNEEEPYPLRQALKSEPLIGVIEF